MRQNVDFDEREVSLSSVLAPIILDTASKPVAEGADLSNVLQGDVSRSIALLRKALSGEPLGLQESEWALLPFVRSFEAQRVRAVEIVAEACLFGDMEKESVEEACNRWLTDDFGSSAHLGPRFIEAALNAWESRQASRDDMLALEATEIWIRSELEALPAGDHLLRQVVEAPLDNLTMLLDTMDGIAPSLGSLSKARSGDFGRQLGPFGLATLSDAVAQNWADSMLGLNAGLAASHFDLFWRGIEGARSLVEQLATNSAEELRWNLRLKAAATWGDKLPDTQMPAWRLEGIRRVPWFVPSQVIEEAFGDDLPGLQVHFFRGINKKWKTQKRKPLPGLEPGSNFLAKAPTQDFAKLKTGGLCRCCGSAADLEAAFFWPVELGGKELQSNLTCYCKRCKELQSRLGMKRFGEVLRAPPEQASEVWWEAQKKANVQYQEFLQAMPGSTS